MLEKIRSFTTVQDMTYGKPLHNIVRFSIPLLIGNFAQQLYATVDSIIVGKMVPGGLAAIGTTMPLLNFMLLMFMAISTGAGIMVSQFFGAKDFRRLNKTIGNTLVLVFLTSLLIMGLGIPLTRPLLQLLNTPVSVLDMAADYLIISLIGIMGAAFYNIISGILRGLGDSLTPLLFLLFSTLMNTGLDVYFVWNLDWGVAGAAWATIISQALSAVLCLFRLFRMTSIPKMEKQDFRLGKDIVQKLWRLGLPAGATQGVFSLAMILVQNLTNQMGTLVMEATTAVIRVDGFAMLPNFTFGMAATTYIGQNIGAGKMDRVEEGSKVIVRLSFWVSVILTALILLFGRPMLGLFTNQQQVIDLGYAFLKILSIGYVAMSLTQSYGGIMRGAGDTMPSLWISILSTVVFRVPLAYLLSYLTRSEEWPHGHPYVLHIALCTGWLMAALLNYLWYRKGKWREKSVVRSYHQEEVPPADIN